MINGTVLKADNLSGLGGIRHGFFTREGGVSDGDYGSLNVGLGSDDARDRVIENRRRVAEHLGANVDGQTYPDIVTTYQVHSAEAVVVEAPFAPDARPKADALG